MYYTKSLWQDWWSKKKEDINKGFINEKRRIFINVTQYNEKIYANKSEYLNAMKNLILKLKCYLSSRRNRAFEKS